MKVYKDINVTTRVVDKDICDWCKKEFEYKDDYPYFEDFTLKYRLYYSGWGDSWSEKGSWFVELCPECIEKLRIFLMENGCSLQEND